MQVSKLKQKLSEKRQQRPRSATLKSVSQTKLSSPETSRAGTHRRSSKVVVTMEQWRHALEQVRPSVSEQEKAKYQRM